MTDEKTQSASDQNSNDKQNVFRNDYQSQPCQERRADYDKNELLQSK